MKFFPLSKIIILLYLLKIPLSAQNDEISKSQSIEHLLINIESSTRIAMSQSFTAKSPKPLQQIHQKLFNLKTPKSVDHIKNYWLSYIDYKQSIFFTYVVKNREQAKEVIHRGIDRLEDMESLNSEDLALLAIMKSFSIQFAESGMEMGKISGESAALVEKAKKLDAQNPRVYYVLGSNSYYTPKMYGGGKEVEENLTQVISIFQSQEGVVKGFQPSWGLRESYYLLLGYYDRENQPEKGKAVLKEAMKKFPKDGEIKRYESKFDTK